MPLLIQKIQGACRNARGDCADCGSPIGQDKGPPDGWQLEDGRTVCHACCVVDTRRIADAVIDGHRADLAAELEGQQ